MNLIQLIRELKENQGLRFDKEGTKLLATTIQLQEILDLAQDDKKFHIISMMNRVGSEFFFHYLERTYFPPDTDQNNQYEYRILLWSQLVWAIATIPIELKQYAYESAKKTKMRLADGIPFTGGPLVANARPECVKELPVKWFPLNSKTAFALENQKDDIAYEGRGGEQEARASELLNLRKLYREKSNEKTLEKYLRYTGQKD